jgi:hypothetical protein
MTSKIDWSYAPFWLAMFAGWLALEWWGLSEMAR